MVYYFTRFLLRLLLRVLWGLKWENIHYVPAQGGVILASNHESFLDPFLVGVSSPRIPVRFMARESLFHNMAVGWLLRQHCAFPVKRGGVDWAAWAQFEDFVKGGECVSFFPEGTRSRDGKLQTANPGSGLLVHRCKGAVVVPTRVFDTHKVIPRGKTFGGFHRVSVVFGPPLDLSREMAECGSCEVYTRIAEKIMTAISMIKPPEGRHHNAAENSLQGGEQSGGLPPEKLQEKGVPQ